jgi:hypothetical protein
MEDNECIFLWKLESFYNEFEKKLTFLLNLNEKLFIYSVITFERNKLFLAKTTIILEKDLKWIADNHQ